jgi:hypothetical protein
MFKRLNRKIRYKVEYKYNTGKTQEHTDVKHRNLWLSKTEEVKKCNVLPNTTDHTVSVTELRRACNTWRKLQRHTKSMFRVVFCYILSCKMIVDRRFRGAYCLHHQGWVSLVGRQSFYTAVYPRRRLWTSYSPPWELKISHTKSSQTWNS